MTAPTAWLLDAGVVSEMMRTQPAPRVAGFLNAGDHEGIGIAAITVWELLDGIGQLESDRRRRELGDRFRWLLDEQFAERIFDWSIAEARACASIMEKMRRRGEQFAGNLPDAMLAATALRHDLAIVTRTPRSFHNSGVRTVDPWAATAQ